MSINISSELDRKIPYRVHLINHANWHNSSVSSHRGTK